MRSLALPLLPLLAVAQLTVLVDDTVPLNRLARPYLNFNIDTGLVVYLYWIMSLVVASV